jgi:hypothetical protein
MFKNTSPASKKTKHVSVANIIWLMLFREIIAAYSEEYTKSINTLCCQNVEFLNVKEAVHMLLPYWTVLVAVVVAIVVGVALTATVIVFVVVVVFVIRYLYRSSCIVKVVKLRRWEPPWKSFTWKIVKEMGG